MENILELLYDRPCAAHEPDFPLRAARERQESMDKLPEDKEVLFQ